jgi:hypothetical protein
MTKNYASFFLIDKDIQSFSPTSEWCSMLSIVKRTENTFNKLVIFLINTFLLVGNLFMEAFISPLREDWIRIDCGCAEFFQSYSWIPE